ncbi:carbon-nitrogen hydrolase family protein [Fervidicoccus fontis]|uniref:Carbon-nitrogen hydrolase family protein n=2 Tax=Fervidicoccus fontis TaxID=683846 RepID=A0A2J6N5C7_9CREN|nr:carbon-nitrogen hydrolase family protein [Fervidicoccus fontis]MBE9390665.1 carbon-nitrogen hydrolase family protein [Fervidicoccus fontis]PMB75818.1 MAG: carbon-nitrogen hydrolase family protein [Fervidicoccus fontis]PMB76537.1 MAG: carbon-nitrogen hydrolase family protein [Fervidicoccus fontis]HEW63859.1 carbon-nitrogen hydrolase family protein [Fervidicoccus fontis]
MKIAIAHMTLKLLSKKLNFERAKKVVHEAKQKGAKVVILPSMINLGPAISFTSPAQLKSILKNHAERIPSGGTAYFLSTLAVQNSIFIISGPILERAGPKVFLTSLAISPTGNIVGKYRKIVLSHSDISIGLSSGKSLEVVDMKEKYGIMAEWDSYHPEIARGLTILGSTVLINFPRIEPVFDKKLKKILETRSIENNVPIMSIGGIIKSQDQFLAEFPSLIYDPYEGLLEEITLESKKEEKTMKVSDEDKVVLLELQNYTQKPQLQEQKYLMELFTTVYKDLKKKMEGQEEEATKHSE